MLTPAQFIARNQNDADQDPTLTSSLDDAAAMPTKTKEDTLNSSYGVNALHSDDTPNVGDIIDGPNGLEIYTPCGYWPITVPQALHISSGLAIMVRDRLTRPWSLEDSSTVLSRGERTAEDID